MPVKKYGRSRNPEGRPGKWKLGKTVAIRVPEVIASELMRIAEELDKKGNQVMYKTCDVCKYIS